jgi:hypothetical protein
MTAITNVEQDAIHEVAMTVAAIAHAFFDRKPTPEVGDFGGCAALYARLADAAIALESAGHDWDVEDWYERAAEAADAVASGARQPE